MVAGFESSGFLLTQTLLAFLFLAVFSAACIWYVQVWQWSDWAALGLPVIFLIALCIQPAWILEATEIWPTAGSFSKANIYEALTGRCVGGMLGIIFVLVARRTR
ncbi:hypothetical protein [Paraburkholderia caffeinilytica]|uniref:hypothetical protein n=1 Tax=Paraburkholderia caffeinilytica TaxID=1761016 RepID=UPI003DA1ADB4